VALMAEKSPKGIRPGIPRIAKGTNHGALFSARAVQKKAGHLVQNI
jgi:hypothetical protein